MFINDNFPSQYEKARHDRIVSLVEQIPELKKCENEASLSSHEKKIISRQIDATDKQIDLLVYELYGLTEEDIRIVEGI